MRTEKTNREALNELKNRRFAALLVDKAVGNLDKSGKLLPWWDNELAALPYYYFNRYNYEQRYNNYHECLEACETWLNRISEQER